jgi:hypothetical protein
MIHYGGYPNPELTIFSNAELEDLVIDCTIRIMREECSINKLSRYEMLRADAELILRHRRGYCETHPTSGETSNRYMRRIRIILFNHK